MSARWCRIYYTFQTKKEKNALAIILSLRKVDVTNTLDAELELAHSNLKIQLCEPKERKPRPELCVITNSRIPLKPDLSLQSSPHFTVTFLYAELRLEASMSSALTFFSS